MNELNTRKKKRRSVIRWILWALLVQFILINISASLYAYKLTHFYSDPSLRNPATEDNVFAKTWKLFTGPRYPKSLVEEKPGFAYEIVTLKTAKGLAIEAWYCAADSLSKGTILLFHGIGGNRGNLLDEAREFHYKGYNIMLVDFRGHGNSDGNTTTIGIKEAEEVKLAWDYVSQKGEKNIFLYGMSLGAVVVTKAISDYRLVPSGIILEMPFLSLQSYLKARARILGFPQQPFAFLTTFWIGIERGFNGYGHHTTAYTKNITCPVLMQWGASDQFVLKQETDKIYNAIASTRKKLVVYNQAQHESLLRNDPLKWRIEVERFLELPH